MQLFNIFNKYNQLHHWNHLLALMLLWTENATGTVTDPRPHAQQATMQCLLWRICHGQHKSCETTRVLILWLIGVSLNLKYCDVRKLIFDLTPELAVHSRATHSLFSHSLKSSIDSTSYALMKGNAKKVQDAPRNTVQLGVFKCDQSSPRQYYWSHKLLWQLEPIPSPSPLIHFNSLSEEREFLPMPKWNTV